MEKVKNSPVSRGETPLETNPLPPTTGLIGKAVVQQQVISEFSGPLPHPSDFQAYERIAPGTAEKIVQMAMRQAEHRQEMELHYARLDEMYLKSLTRDSLLGLIFGLIISLSVVAGSVVCILHGFPVSGSLLGLTGLTGLVGTFIYGSRSLAQGGQQKNSSPPPKEPAKPSAKAHPTQPASSASKK